MMLIVCYVLVEIVPIWLVLDGNFVDIFLKFDALFKDLISPLLLNDVTHLHNINPQQVEQLMQVQQKIDQTLLENLQRNIDPEDPNGSYFDPNFINYYQGSTDPASGMHGLYTQAPTLSFVSSIRQSELLFGNDSSLMQNGMN